MTKADWLTVSGVLLVSGGAGWLSPPAGLIVFGLSLAAVGLILDIAAARVRAAEERMRKRR